jgi:cytochrome c-type biogenesis protein CcmH
MPGFAMAAIDTFEFADEDQQARYQQFIDEMRCPKCDNQSLSGSNSAIAMDLRKQLYTMVQNNQTDDEIITYMVDRYGDFILYKPRVTSSTIFLWAAPILFLLIGLVILFLLLKSRKNAVTNQNLSVSERAELDQLLKQYSDSSNTQNNTEDKSS